MWGEGKEGKRAVSTNVCNFIQIYSRCKLGIVEGRGRGKKKGKGGKSARDFLGDKEREEKKRPAKGER